nr:hypothetical protein [Tanacetum cinerariifolium]
MSVDINEEIELVDDQEKDAQVKGRQADTQAEIYNIDLDHTSKVLSMQEDTEVQEVVEVVNAAKLMTEVATTAASIPIPAVEPAVVAISAAKPAAKPKVLKIIPNAPTVSTRKRKGVVIRDPEEELHDDTLAETLSDKDKGKGILVEDPKPMKKKDQIEMDAEYARKLQEEEESHVQAKDVQATDAPAKEIQYIRRYHVDEDDAVLIEATPIGRKAPVVNYEIVMINNKPRGDLKDLWKIVKARFSTSKPTNFIDDYLLVTLKNMFEKTDAQDVI